MENQKGRSMIEMLGVLAIVGVLSVGGIAGYSQAMRKYKLIRLTEEYNMLIQEIAPLLDQIQRAYPNNSKLELLVSIDTSDKMQLASVSHKKDTPASVNRANRDSLLPFLRVAGILPKNWKYEENNDILYNSMGGKVTIKPGVIISTTLSGGSMEDVLVCQNLVFNVAIPNTIIKSVGIKGTTENENSIRDTDMAEEMVRHGLNGAGRARDDATGLVVSEKKGNLSVSSVSMQCSNCKVSECEISMGTSSESSSSFAQANKSQQGVLQ